MKPYKAWVADEALHQGVCEGTIHRWRKRKRFFQLVFHHETQRVFVSGTTIKLPLEPTGRKFIYPWSTVDWSLSDRLIAEALGATRSAVNKARRRYQS